MAFAHRSLSNAFWGESTSERINGQLGSDRAAAAARRGRAMTLDEISTYLVDRLDALGIEPAEA